MSVLPFTTVGIKSRASAEASPEGSGDICFYEGDRILLESLETQEECFAVTKGSSRTHYGADGDDKQPLLWKDGQ